MYFGDDMTYETTSNNTKKMIETVFKETVCEKPLSKVTVSEIIMKCGINRKTFYYHFDDIYALLKWTLEQEAINVVKGFDLLTELDEAIYFIMDYVEKNEDFLRNVYFSVGREELKRFFYNDFVNIVTNIFEMKIKINNVDMDDDFKAFLIDFYSEAIAGVLLDWIVSYPTSDKDKTVKYISTIINNAIK